MTINLLCVVIFSPHLKVKIDLTSEMISDNSPNITLLSEMWKTSSLPGKYDCFSAAVKDFVATESFFN